MTAWDGRKVLVWVGARGGVTVLDHYTAKAVVLSVLIKPWGTIC